MIKKKLSEEQRKSYNRAITVAILGIGIVSWVMINAGTFITNGLLYAFILLLGVLGYKGWNSF